MRFAIMPKAWQFLLRDIATSFGISLLICSPYFLEKVVSEGYYAFNILDYFLIPHLESVGALALLIFCTLQITRRFGISSRWILILIAAIFLVFVFRGFFSAAGISVQEVALKVQGWLSFISPDRFADVTFRRIGLLALFLICLALLLKFVRDTKPLFRACAAFGWMLGILTVIRVIPLLITEVDFAKDRQHFVHQSEPSKLGDKRVVWVIFDELDFNRTFLNRNHNIALPNLDSLRTESVFAENAVSPAWLTNLSFPAMITGTYITEANPVGAARLLLHTPTGVVEWQNTSNLFSRLNDKGKQIDIIGYYHPYCNIFPFATPCLSVPTFAFHAWWWSIWQGLRIIPGVDQFSRKYSWTNAAYDRSTQLQLAALETHLSNKSSTLSFLHFDIPHLPGGRLHGLEVTPAMKSLPGYEQNLLTVDWAVGEIVKSLEAQGQSRNTLLIVSSDHWLRVNLANSNLAPDQAKLELGANPSEVHKIPLFIRHLPEKTGQVISQPINTIYSAQLIEDFLDGKLSDHASIAAWWQNKQFVAPITQ